MHGKITSMADIGRVVGARRRQLGFTQTRMAAELGLTQRYLSELENGKTSSLNARTLDVLDELGIKLSFRGEDEQLPRQSLQCAHRRYLQPWARIRFPSRPRLRA